MDTKKFFVSFLVAALCAIPISSYCNHRRLRIGVAAQKSKLGSAKSKPGSIQNGKKLLSKEEVATLAREVLGEDFQGGFLIHKVMLDGKPFLFCDLASSNVVDIVSREIGVSTYDFSNIDFKEGDVVIDIGGNVGMISIFLAKKFPFLKIYAFEPVRENFENFKRNIKLNEIPDGTIVVENLAVTKNGRDISMLVNTLVSGSSAMAEYAPKNEQVVLIAREDNIRSITLKKIFKKYDIKTCKLLKIDCEGAEYEILYNTDKNILKRCEYLRGEFHEDARIREAGYSADALKKYCDKIIDKIDVVVHVDEY